MSVTYLDGPHASKGPAQAAVQQAFPGGPYYEWWDANQAADGTWTYDGCTATLDWLETYLQQYGPFDGLLGFSQGAALAALMVLLQQRGLRFQAAPCFRLALLAGGSKSRDSAHAALWRPADLACASVHLIGDADTMKRYSRDLSECFSEPLVLHHPQGHVVPRLDAGAHDALADYLKQALQQEWQPQRPPALQRL